MATQEKLPLLDAMHRRDFLKTTVTALALLPLVGHAHPLEVPQTGGSSLPVDLPAEAPSSKKHLFLTMDDGYQNVEAVIAQTRDTGVAVTFFPTGQALLAHPEGWRTLYAQGHEFGCHTFSHPEASYLSAEAFREELRKWQGAAQAVLGDEAVRGIRYFRFPYGDTGRYHRAQFARIVTQEFGWRIVGWDLCLDDIFPHGTSRHKTPLDFGRGLLKHANANDIVLMHFVNPDAFSLTELFERAREHNFEFKPLSAYPTRAHYGAVGV